MGGGGGIEPLDIVCVLFAYTIKSVFKERIETLLISTPSFLSKGLKRWGNIEPLDIVYCLHILKRVFIERIETPLISTHSFLI